jgi:hypothetical protein
MKKLSLLLIVCSFFAATSVFGQSSWSGSSLASTAYRTGKTAIGLTTYGSKLVIRNGTSNELALYNDGRIHAREIEVNLDVIPDYVFADNYELMPLAELQKFIALNHHLPNIKSAEEYAAYGRIPLKELNLKLLEKV